MDKKALFLPLVLFTILIAGQNWSQAKDLAGSGTVQDDGAPVTTQQDAPAQVVIWHHSWSEDPANIADLAESGFVTHVLISNLDFNEEPESSIAEKVQVIRDHGLIPIWGRWLWFQDGDRSTADFAQPFLEDYADGTIVFNADYYAWFLQALRAEAARYGVDLVAVDVEPYGDPNNLRTILRGDGTQEWFDRVQQAVSEALSRPGVLPADYIYPTDMFIVEYNGYRALSGLGTNKITEVTEISKVSPRGAKSGFDFWTLSTGAGRRVGA